MASIWNKGISISIFGESHGTAIGVVMDNIPAGMLIDIETINSFMSRRAPSLKKYGSTKRKESDMPEVLSGILNGKTIGTPICAIIYNENQRSNDYDDVKNLIRPGHADFTGNVRYNGFNDMRGGGHFSGRLTAPLTFAGAICAQILKVKNISTFAHISSIGSKSDDLFNSLDIDLKSLEKIASKPLPVLNDNVIEQIEKEIKNAHDDGDSVGGTIECMVVGVPAGIGSPMFDGIENDISSLAFGVPAVRGIEFGAGFKAATMRGSSHNDDFYVHDLKIRTKTNNHGGILGGITSGMPIVFRVAIKPTPSIGKMQNTVNLKNMVDDKIEIKGRHDACIVPRAVPVIESVANIAILSQMINQGKF